MERFIAKKLYGSDDGVRGGSRPAIIIATTGIALGLAVMIITLAVTRGFKEQVREKVIDFTQHIQVTNYKSSMGSDEQPVTCSAEILSELESLPEVQHVQRFIQKPGIVRTDSSFQGFLLKGVGSEYDYSFLNRYLIEGYIPNMKDSLNGGWLLLSKTLTEKLKLKIGDRVDVYFMQNSVRARKMTLTGVYQTNFSGYDMLYGITDINTLQRLNGWDSIQATGLEIRLSDESLLDTGYSSVRKIMDRYEDKNEETYLIETMNELNGGLFAWLDILNVNVWAILILMLGIAGFTMISGLLIIIFERTRTIGILKALGANDKTIRKIFLILAARIIGKGMLIGDAIGISICLIQQYSHILPLDPANYYLDSVPIELRPGWLLILNIAMFLISLLMLIGPSAIISKINPSESIRYE
jgi:lipoprotein-releasing system permease protein